MKKHIWFNTKLYEQGEASLDPLDRGFLLGDGLFETMAVHEGRVLNFAAHLARLRQGCDVLNLPFPSLDLEKAVQSLTTASQLQKAVVRLTWSRGVGGRGVLPLSEVQPTLLITADAWPLSLAPARCVVSQRTRRNEFSPLCHVKSLNYLDSILARLEATERGADEAILLATSGFVAEATASNVFIRLDGKILTPPLADGALPGTRRAEIIRLLDVVERRVHLEELFRADEIFLTNALSIRAVVSVDGWAIGGGETGEVYRKLMD